MFQIEVTYRALLAGFRVTEVPIVFRDRSVGTSKMSAPDRGRGNVGGAAPAPQRTGRAGTAKAGGKCNRIAR